MPKCRFVMDPETGRTCGMNPLRRSDLCVSHDPDNREAQQEARSKGGKNRHKAKHPLRSPQSILQTLEDLLKITLSEKPIAAPFVQAALRACDLALKTLDAGEWTDRMAALETKMTYEENRRARAIRDAAEAQDWGDPEPQAFLPPQPDDPSWLHRGPGKWVGGKWVYTGGTTGTEEGGTQMNADNGGLTQITASDWNGEDGSDEEGNGGEGNQETDAESAHESPGCRSGRTEQASCAMPATDVPGDGPRVWVAPQPDNTVIKPPAGDMYDIPLATYTARRKARAGLLPPWPHLLDGPY